MDRPIHELAELDYVKGMKYKDIAEKYGKSINTIKSWSRRYEWIGHPVQPKKEKPLTKKQKVAGEVAKVAENTELTDKQKLFCLYYAKSFNATRSYQKAYGGDYLSACTCGPRLLHKVAIKDEIMRMKEERYAKVLLKPSDILQKYMDIAFADITDFMEFGNKDITTEDKNGEEYDITVSHVNIKNDHEVDGTIISEVSKGREGVKVKLADRMRALDWLAEHMNMSTERQKAELDALKARSAADTVDKDIKVTFEGTFDNEWTE